MKIKIYVNKYSFTIFDVLSKTDKAIEVQNKRGHIWLPLKALEKTCEAIDGTNITPHEVYKLDEWFLKKASREQLYVLYLEELLD